MLVLQNFSQVTQLVSESVHLNLHLEALLKHLVTEQFSYLVEQLVQAEVGVLGLEVVRIQARKILERLGRNSYENV